MGFNVPQQPQSPGPFSEQHGYVDIQVKTYDYDGNCSPINKNSQHEPSSFEKFSKNENTKKAGNFVWGHLKGFLVKQLCS